MPSNHPWVLLLVAGLLEVGWAVALKASEGFTRLWPSLAAALAMLASLALLTLALRDLPVGTGYAVWTGIGAVGTAIVGIVWLGEPAGAARMLSLLTVAVGLAGLKLTS